MCTEKKLWNIKVQKLIPELSIIKIKPLGFDVWRCNKSNLG